MGDRKVSRVGLRTALFLMIVGFLFSGPVVAQAGEQVILAKAGKARSLSDKELGTVTGGELVICGSSSKKDKACGGNKDSRTQIILWDERGPHGKPPQNSQGSYSTTNGGGMNFRSDIRISN